MALHGSVVGPFRGFDIAPEHREFISSVLELEQSRALRRHRFREIRFALATLARRTLDSRHNLPHFCVELLAQAAVLGDLTLVLWIVAAVLTGQFVQLRFSLVEICLQPLNERIVENVRQPVQGPAPFEKFARLLFPGAPLERLFLRFHHLLRQRSQPGAIDVGALVNRDNSLPLEIIRQLRLGILQIGTQGLQLLVIPLRRLPRRFYAQFEHRVDVGFGERVGDPRRMVGIGG